MDNENKCREEINSHTLDTAGRWERKIWSLVQLNSTLGNPFLALPAGEGEAHLALAGPRASELNPWGGLGGSCILWSLWLQWVLGRSRLLPMFQSQDVGNSCPSRIP